MRELKYRVWDNSDEEWSSVSPHIRCSHNKGYFELEGSKYQRDNCIIQQFTGLKDSKGNEVYEGDIVEFLHKGKTIFSKITYYSNVGMFAVAVESNQEMEIETRKCLAEVCFFEVVGNIFENSELLENKD